MVLSQTSHCALVILMTLAHNYETKGLLLSEISDEHHIPIEILTPIAQRLCEAGILRCEAVGESDPHYLFLKRDPFEISVYDIVMLFDGDVFPGRFINPETGKLLPPSPFSNAISFERKHILGYMRKRLKKVNIAFWCKQANKHLPIY